MPEQNGRVQPTVVPHRSPVRVVVGTLTVAGTMSAVYQACGCQRDRRRFRPPGRLYDRSGLGWSDPGPRPHSAGRIADELHQLLDAAGVPAPYLLVGHSLGGMVVRLYAARHPDAVAGMVLVDPTPEDYQRRIGRLNWRSSIPGIWLQALKLRLPPLGCAALPATSASAVVPAAPPPASTHSTSERRAWRSP
jgi:pimeloyl-ACP methyl ester carboxylesterase